jgi:phytoene/squalene synthetase
MVMLERTDAGLAQTRLRETDPTASPESKAAIERAHAQIALLYAGRPERPLTRALRDAIGRFDLRSGDFLVIIEGMKTVSSTDLGAPSYERLDRYCEHTAVAVNRIALRILAAAQPDCERRASALGRGMQLTVILRDLVQDAVRQRLYLPRELLHTQGIYATMPSYVLAQPALPWVCDALAKQAAAYFADAESATVTVPGWAMLATIATLSSYRTLLKALRSRGWTRLDDPVRIPGLAPNGAAHRTRSHWPLISPAVCITDVTRLSPSETQS